MLHIMALRICGRGLPTIWSLEQCNISEWNGRQAFFDVLDGNDWQ